MSINGSVDGSIVVDTELDTQGFEAGTDKMQNAVDSAIKGYEKLGATLGATTREAQKFVDEWAHAMPEKEFQASVDAITKQVDSMAAKLSEVEQLYSTALDGESAAVAKFENKATSAEAALDKIGLKMDELYHSSVKTENAELISGAEMDSFKMLADQFDSIFFKLGDMQNKIAEVKGESAGMVPSSAPQVEETTQALERTAEQADKVAENTDKAEKKTNILISTLKAVGKVGVTSFKFLGKGVSAVVSQVKSLGKSADGTMAAAKKITKSFTSFGARIKSLLKRRIIRSILNGAIEGVKNLAQVSPEVNAAMSSIVTALSQLKNSFGSAFAPILTTVAPILTNLIDLLSEAFTKVGMLIAALTGASSFKKAVTVQKDYAASLKDTAQQASKAQKSLAGFDELNNRTTQQNTSSATIDPSSMFEEVPIDSKIKAFADRIKKAFLNGDFEGIGSAAAAKVNSIFKKINGVLDNEKVTSRVVNFVSGLTKGFNRFIHDTDFDQIGTAIGKGVNKVVDVIHAFWTGVDWKQLGSQLSSGLNGIIKKVNWKKLGQTVGARFQAVLGFLNGVITHFDFTALASGIATGINNALSSIDWAMLGQTLSSGIKGVFDAITTFARTVDWAQIGKDIAAFLNNIDWAGVFGSLARALSAILSGLLDTLISFVSTLDWEKLGKELWNSLVAIITNIKWGDLIAKAFKLLGAAIAGIGNLVKGLIEAIWGAIVKGYNGMKSYFSEKIEECGGNIVLGILKGIVDALVGIGKWIYDHIFKPIWDGICGVFGIHSPSTKMMEIGKDLILGLLNGLKDLVVDVLKFFGQLALDILEALASLPGKLFDLGKKLISRIWDGVKSVSSTLISGMSTVAGWVWDGVKALPDKLFELGKKIITKLAEGIEWCIDKVKTAVGAITDVIIGPMKVQTDSAYMSGQHISRQIGQGMLDEINKVRSASQQTASVIKGNLGFSEPEEGPLSDFHTYMPDMIQLMVKGIRENKKYALNAVADLAAGMAEEAQDASVLVPINAENKYTNFLNNFSDKITEAFLLLIKKLEAIAGGVTFATPALATGTVLPYRINSSSDQIGGGDSNGGKSTDVSDIIAMMERLEKKLDDVVDAIDEKETGITDADVYKSVKNSVRKEKKSTGRDPFGE